MNVSSRPSKKTTVTSTVCSVIRGLRGGDVGRRKEVGVLLEALLLLGDLLQVHPLLLTCPLELPLQLEDLVVGLPGFATHHRDVVIDEAASATALTLGCDDVQDPLGGDERRHADDLLKHLRDL